MASVSCDCKDALSTQLIPVQECRKFTSDPCFAEIRDTIKTTGGSVVQGILESSERNGTEGGMDQAFFGPERFELVVDARGYAPQDIRCSVTQEQIDILATASCRDGAKRRTTTMTRSYLLPKRVAPERGSCWLSSDGILAISVPWGDR